MAQGRPVPSTHVAQRQLDSILLCSVGALLTSCSAAARSALLLHGAPSTVRVSMCIYQLHSQSNRY